MAARSHPRASTRRATLVRHGVRTVATNGFLAVLCLFTMFPFAWMLMSSMKPLDEIFSGSSFFPEAPTLDSYARLFERHNVGRAILNSFLFASATTAVALFSSTLSGYAFAKFRFPGRMRLFGFIVASMALPSFFILVPLFVEMSAVFHWINTPWPLIVPAAAAAFGIFFMRQYMLAFPQEVIDAARVDGGSEWSIFRRVVVPMSLPGMASLGLLTFVTSWNGFLWPKVVLRSPDLQTLPLLVTNLSGGTMWGTPWDMIMAGSVISIIPTVSAVVFLRRQFLEGITGGAVKG